MITFIDKTEDSEEIETSRCAILIVDDSETDRVTYRRYLESANDFRCGIFDCETGEDALDWCDCHCPDVILLDYLLADTDGLQFLQDLTDRIGKLPQIVMLTGQGNEEIAVEAMKHGVRDYLVKGQLTAQRLVSSVANALNEQKPPNPDREAGAAAKFTGEYHVKNRSLDRFSRDSPIGGRWRARTFGLRSDDSVQIEF